MAIQTMTTSAATPRSGNAIRSDRILAKRERVRQALLATAARLIADRGLESISVEEILAEVGISRRTFYGYFANKYELAASVVTPALVDGEAMLAKLEEEPETAALAGIVDCYYALWDRHREALVAISSLQASVMPYMEDHHNRFVKALDGMLKRAERAGVLRNGDAGISFRIISRTAVPLLKIYASHPRGARLYRESMLALLGSEGGRSE